MSKPLQRIPRSQLLAVTMSILAKQGGKCPICCRMINTKVAGRSSDYVADHDHKTGEIRGVLHRSCNAAEGKVANAAGAWGAKSMAYEDIVPFVEGLVTYWKNAEKYGTGMMYPEHKTDEQKKAAASLKRRKAYAANKAKQKVKDNASKR
ncbi:putative DNA endonuclease VII [Acinetobacter phage vB_AbaP_Acibel007]|uniref:Putative DNA endonuclease VII n=1 Tax=Acinetobacter phage vB_AbaP_Acibel007 TaxID=1481187 RepID=A0A075DXB4_9CAUD|nr:endonuclease VII [Acinetobacter phage vB_AbaP_Acibel007]AHY26799.1 putative DNA endonuclease VII [Acinetobacter phage vB_AbaP_Acibel007]